MKKEIHPGVFIAVLVLLIGGAIVAFMMSGGGSDTKKVDVKSLDPASLLDEEPPKRGEPGYRERTTDPVTK
jgi:predicted nucleotidyltransferase